MKIKEIKEVDNVYIVTLTPNLWIEKLFGVKEKIEKFKCTGATFIFGGGSVYVDRTGEELCNNSFIGTSIDKWKRSW